jgi:LCP family protein required for cell wall assembly
MRTTLKRGLGSSAGVNGNGRAVLPPGVLTPVTRYRQPERRRSIWRSLARMFLLTIVICSSLIFGAAGGAYLEALAAVEDLAPSEQVKIALKQLDIPPPNAPANALVIGYDHRPEDGTAPSRSDTVMLLRADPQAETITTLSFPRDLIVEVRCPNGGRSVDRINAAYSYCGPEGTLETVRALTNLPIHYIITVNFEGFRKVIDRLGGVWIDVDRRYFNNNRNGRESYAEINLWPGYQRLRGWQALDYVRYRHFDSDIYRVARQQTFVKAVKQAVNARFQPGTVPKMVGALRNNVEIGQASGEVSLGTLISYALFGYGLPSGHFFQVKLGGLTGMNELHADTASIQAAVTEFVKPDVDAPEKATAVALRRRARLRSGPSPRNVSVVALNGNGVEGAAANASYQLSQRGYRVIGPPEGLLANAPRRVFRTQVYYSEKQGARVAAARLGNLFGSVDLKPLPLRNRTMVTLANGAMVTVVLGVTYKGALAPAPVDRTPPRREADVRTATSETIHEVRKASKWNLDFPLMVPTKIDRGSSLDSEVPTRVYKIGKRKTVRLTFRNGATEYWGIQMTDWEDAPALKDANETLTIKGRKYSLYYDGPDLHMVVLHHGGASYWVVNTVLDKLSNETMLEIAKGLHPFKK